MSDARFQNFLRELADETKYVRVPDVTIFDEHEERNKKGQVVRKFTRAELQKIADSCNQRDATGTLSPLTIGHTQLDEPDETKQPPSVGVAYRYRVVYDPVRKKHLLKTNFYIRRDKYKEASTYPRVSIELWPDDEKPIIDPISFLRRTPRLDVGQWTYSASGRAVLRYQMDVTMTQPRQSKRPKQNAMPPADDMPPIDAPAPGPDAPVEPSHEEKVDQFMRHCCGHPHAKYMAEHYAMPAEPPGGADDLPPIGDPTGPPSVEDPVQNAAMMPSATNTALPTQNARDQAAIQFARYEKRLAELEARTATAESKALVTQLLAEDYVLDMETEVLQFAKLNEKQRQERADWIRKHVKKAPVNGADEPWSPIPVDTRRAGQSSQNARVVDLENDPESCPVEDQHKIMQYSARHKLYDMPFHKVAELAMPEKYGRQNTNGSTK